MNELKHYLQAIERQLRLPREIKRRIMGDLTGDLQARLESGQTPDQIMQQLGDPARVARNFRQEFAEALPAAGPSRWRWLFLGCAVLVGLAAVGQLCIASWQRAGTAAAIGIIGGADGPTAIYVTTKFSSAGLLPPLAGLVCGFLLFRWNGFGTRRQYTGAAVLAGAGLALWAVRCALDLAGMAAVGGSSVLLPTLLSGFANLLSPGFWLPAVMLVWALWCLKKAEPKQEK